MIYTVFSTSTDDAGQWQSQLLEYSWSQVEQPGELVRLVATAPGELLPRERLARVVETLSWAPHPYTNDPYPLYNKPASLLQWIFEERINGTILLLEPRCVLRAPVQTELEPGLAQATGWKDLPRMGRGPFGLGARFGFLDQFCVNRSLELPAVTLPLLIHSSDLRRLAARWLEVMGIIRSEMGFNPRSGRWADRLAYSIAAAEAGIDHLVAELGAETDARESRASILDYHRPIESKRGEIVWDERVYEAWDPVDPKDARPGIGRDFLELLDQYIGSHQAGGPQWGSVA